LIWWGLLAVAVAIPLLLFGLFRWASADSAIDRVSSRERFRAQQEIRWLRRSHASSASQAPGPQPFRTEPSQTKS